MKIGKLFIGKEKCNEDDRFILASWSYKSGYWIWVLDWRKPKRILHTMKFPIPKTSYACGTKFFACKGMFSSHITIPFIGTFSLSTQPKCNGMDY